MPPSLSRHVSYYPSIHPWWKSSSSVVNAVVELDKENLEKKTVDEKVSYYDTANKQVAILCNHQKSVSKNFEVSTQKMRDKVDTLLFSTILNGLRLMRSKKRLSSTRITSRGSKGERPP